MVDRDAAGEVMPGIISRILAVAMNKNRVPMKGKKGAGILTAGVADLIANGFDNDLQAMLPARHAVWPYGKLAGHQSRNHHQHGHGDPGKHQSSIQNEEARLPENDIVRG